MIYVVATLKIHPADREALVAAARPCIEGTRREEGCLHYDLHQSVTDPDTYVFVERWTGKDRLQAHTQTPHFKTWRDASRDMIAARTIEVITPESVDDL